jgi:hypothetical protein
VRDLEARYPQLFPHLSSVASTPIRTTTGTTSNTSHIAFDLTAVMKATQAILSEIETRSAAPFLDEDINRKCWRTNRIFDFGKLKKMGD